MSLFSFAPEFDAANDDFSGAVKIRADAEKAHERWATRVSWDGEGTVPVYAEDIPVDVMPTPHVEQYVDGRYAGWIRIECKVARHKTCIQPGDWYVLGRWPYSTSIVEVAQFKPPFKKKWTERPVPGGDVVSSEDFINWVDSLPFDYFETRDVLTAAISLPDVCSLRDPQARNEYGRGYYIHGSCSNIDELARHLILSKDARNLIEMTEANTIPFHYVNAKLGNRPRLKERTISSCEDILKLSVYQALAGPERGVKEIAGMPVIEKVRQLYSPHLNARNQRKRSQP